MKQLIIPIAIGLLAGLGGGSGYAYMKASAKYVKDSTHVADSLKAHPPADSTESAEHADSSHGPAVDSTAHAAPMTPADSLRALEAARLSLKDATKGVPNAADHATPVKGKASAPPAKVAPAPAPTAAPAAPAANTSMPEQRLAKIFGAMQAKDAAKVLEQMTDSDVRAILGVMSDKQAAAILTTFPAPRAAAITKGPLKAPKDTP
jgi:hypothetical protein